MRNKDYAIEPNVKIESNRFPYKTFYCPFCNNKIGQETPLFIDGWSSESFTRAITDPQEFCNNCGQKIDWENVWE